MSKKAPPQKSTLFSFFQKKPSAASDIAKPAAAPVVQKAASHAPLVASSPRLIVEPALSTTTADASSVSSLSGIRDNNLFSGGNIASCCFLDDDELDARKGLLSARLYCASR